MDETHCALCNNFLKFTKYNLKNASSRHSHVSLMSLVEKVTGSFFSKHFNICLQCYDLINELDAIELRQIELHNQLKQYFEKNRQLVCKDEITLCTTELGCSTIEDSIKSEIKNDNNFICCNESDKQYLNNHLLGHTGSNENINKDLVSKDLKIHEKPYNLTDKFMEGRKNEKGHLANIKFISNEPNVKKKGRRKKNLDIIKPHKCHHCSKVFRTSGELKNHMNSHSNYRPFVCDICGQSYKHKAAFNVHVNMHSGINPFTCVYCNKSFTQKGALVRHAPIHTGETPYQCDECGKRFIHHTSFNIHRLSHTGEKSYKCNLCGLAFMSASHLKRHMRIHTGEKKFGCIICGKRFAEKYNLVVHEKLHFNPDSVLSQKGKQSSKTEDISEGVKLLDKDNCMDST